MSANGDDRFTVEEAAEKLRAIKQSAGEDALREFFQTGGGLLDFEEDDLTAAVAVVGEQRAAQILGVDVPSGGAPGEQAALPGREQFPDQARERAEPTPRGAARLSEFGVDGDDEPDGEPEGDRDCRSFHAQLDRLLSSARRQGFLDANEFDTAVGAAERAGCVSSADATRLRDTAQSAAPEPTDRQFDQLFDDVRTAFAGGRGNR